MRFIAQISLVVLFGVGCKSYENTQVTTQPLSYRTQQTFNTVFFDASKQKVLNNQEKAIQLFLNALKINPNCHACMFELSSLYLDLKNYPLSLKYGQYAIQTNTEYNHWYFNRVAQSYQELNRYDLSAKVYEDMIFFEPENRQNFLNAADAFYRAKEYAKSISILKEIQQRFGVEQASTLQLKSIYIMLGEHDKAIQELEKLANAYPKKVSYWGYLSEAYRRDNQPQKAIQILEKVIKIDPNSGKAYFSLFTILQSQGEEKTALEYLENALICDDLSLEIKLQALNPFIKKVNENKEVVVNLVNILADYYPNSSNVYLLKSIVYDHLNETEYARNFIRKGLEKDPGNYLLWKKIIQLNDQLFDYRQQIEDLNRAIDLFPSVVFLLERKSSTLNQLGQYEKALETANKGLTIAFDPVDNADLTIHKATAMGRLGDTAQACKLFEHVLSIDSSHIDGLNSYSLFLAYQNKQLRKANTMIEKALNLQPLNPDLLATKASLVFASGDIDEALELLSQAIELNPKNPFYYKQKRIIYEYLKKPSMVEKMNQNIKSLSGYEL